MTTTKNPRGRFPTNGERGMHYYVFELTETCKNIPSYERTCGTERAAQALVKELASRKGTIAAFYTVDSVPTKFWY